MATTFSKMHVGQFLNMKAKKRVVSQKIFSFSFLSLITNKQFISHKGQNSSLQIKEKLICCDKDAPGSGLFLRR